MAVLLLRPSGKDYLWGGQRLKEIFAKDLDCNPLAETWECSTHPDGPSFVVGGEFDGLSLTEVLKSHPEFLGSRYTGTIYAENGQLPILVKFIDARQNLSVQVHPDNEYAAKFENGSLGKNEMWYVVDTEGDASLVYGLKSTASVDEVRSCIETGTLENLLNFVPVKAGDAFYIKAGTIHAIGAGCLIAEIQQSSNVTYRLYDYNRRDKNGNLRELHIGKALDVSNLEGVSGTGRCNNGDEVCSCPYFVVNKLVVNGLSRELCADEGAFKVLLCLEGSGEISDGGDTPDGTAEDLGKGTAAAHFRKGDCLFIPASSRFSIDAHSPAEFLEIRSR